jgi:hypothetical protein
MYSNHKKCQFRVYIFQFFFNFNPLLEFSIKSQQNEKEKEKKEEKKNKKIEEREGGEGEDNI